MDDQLNRVQIQGFKSIRSLDLSMGGLNVLVGANGAGKSNFLECFDLLGDLIRLTLRSSVARRGGAQSLLHWGPPGAEELRLDLHFGKNGYAADLAPTVDGAFYFEREQCWFQAAGCEHPYDVRLGVGHRESRLPEEATSQGVAGWVLRTMSSWRRFHFHDTSDRAAVKQPQSVDDNRELARDARNLAPFLFLLRETQRSCYDRIVSAVNLVAPFFSDFSLRPDPHNPQSVKLEWKRADGQDAGASSLSDGTLRFMCLATLLLQPGPPSLVLVDEPELGLHPFAINILVDLLRAGATQTQLIVATQSVTLLNQLELGDIVVVERHDEASQFDRPDSESLSQWLEDYSLGELWEKNVLGGRPTRA